MLEDSDLVPIPQPKPHPILKNLPDLDRETPILGFMNLARSMGELFRIVVPGNREIVMASSQALVHELCDETRFDKKIHGPLQEIRALAGDGLFTAYTEEANWGLAHRILMPALGPIAIREMFDPMLDIAEQLVVRWERFGPDQVIDIVDNMTRLTLDTIALCAFDYRFNSFYRDEMHPFVDAMVGGLSEAGDRSLRSPIQTMLMPRARRRFENDAQFMHHVADELIAQRRQDPAASEKKDLLSRMLQSKDPKTGRGLSDENIRFQMVTFLIAGHETTSGLLSFALYMLLKNPKTLQRARAQVDEVLGTNTPRVEDMVRLSYLEQVLKESLRIWPTAPAFARTPYEDTVLGGKYRLAKGTNVLILVPMLHRDPTVWGDDPEGFNPDRFAPEAEAALPPDAYKPFGTGQRACIGRAFAMQEAQLVLALLLQRFDLFEHDPSYQLRIKQTLTLKPEGFLIRARPRGGPTQSRSAIAHADSIKTVPQSIPAAGPSTGPLTPLLVLYGSNAGSAEAFARRIASDARNQGFAAEVEPMDNRAGQLPSSGAVIVVTASYEGQPPDNAKLFLAWIEGLAPKALSGVRFAVFGCGHRDWVRTYQAVPNRVDTALTAAGASQILARGEADAGGDFFGHFDTWCSSLWPALAAAFGKTAHQPTTSPQLQVELVPQSRASRLGQSELTTGIVIENRELTNMEVPNARSKRHLEVQLPEGMTYRAGDYLAVLPTNPWTNVVRAINRFGLAPDQSVILRQDSVASTLPTGYPISVSELLSSYVELGQPATRKQIETLIAATPCPPEQKSLEALLNDPAYETEVLGKRVSVLDLLERTASCSISFAAFLEMLPAMRARQYSISSSPLWNDRRCTLTVAVLDGPAWSGTGRYLGAASNYLAHAQAGMRISLAVRPSNIAFHPPASLATPIIMVCAGTGIAPFRGFLQDRAQRAESGEPMGRAILFFGCNHPDVDFLYREELEAWQARGIVEVRAAFSSQGSDIKYVQHRLWADRADVADLFRQGAMVFVCGDAKRLLPALRETGMRIYQEVKGGSLDEANQWMADLEQNHSRYYADVFA